MSDSIALLHRLILRPVAAGALVFAVLLLATGCGSSGDGGPTGDLHATSIDDPFRVVKSEDGHKLIAGHGIAFAVPDDWKPEYKETSDSDAFSWELHAAGGEPFPPFLNFTVVKKKDSADRVKEVATAAEGVAKVSEEGYELVDSGTTDVPGSDSARKLSFKRTLNLKSDGNDYPIEQRMLFFRTSGDHIVTVRFIAPQGKYENSRLAEIADSLVAN